MLSVRHTMRDFSNQHTFICWLMLHFWAGKVMQSVPGACRNIQYGISQQGSFLWWMRSPQSRHRSYQSQDRLSRKVSPLLYTAYSILCTVETGTHTYLEDKHRMSDLCNLRHACHNLLYLTQANGMQLLQVCKSFWDVFLGRQLTELQESARRLSANHPQSCHARCRVWRSHRHILRQGDESGRI